VKKEKKTQGRLKKKIVKLTKDAEETCGSWGGIECRKKDPLLKKRVPTERGRKPEVEEREKR